MGIFLQCAQNAFHHSYHCLALASLGLNELRSKSSCHALLEHVVLESRVGVLSVLGGHLVHFLQQRELEGCIGVVAEVLGLKDLEELGEGLRLRLLGFIGHGLGVVLALREVSFELLYAVGGVPIHTFAMGMTFFLALVLRFLWEPVTRVYTGLGM